MAEVVLGAVSIVSGCLVAPVNRLCGYVISYEGDVSELKAKVAELGIAKQNVKDSINYAQNNAKRIRAHVNEWVEDVEEDTKEARRVLDADERAEKTCFYGRLPNLKVRYRLSREVRRKAKDIQRLISRIPFGQVYDDPPPGLVDGASDMISSAGDRGDTIFESRASILEDIMNALGDEKHKVIGIYGEGGVGKTTLLEQVEKKLGKEGRPFEMIVNAKVLRNLDFNDIQGQIADIQVQIADALKLDLKDTHSQQGRRNLLLKRLQKDSSKILIILDDLWKDFDLREGVGIPSKDESKGCKLLLTSRFKDVLEQMKCDTPIFHLEGLKDKEAFRLFEKTVGDRLKDDKESKAIAPEVVKKLAGLPLLIISVACGLKHQDVTAWRVAEKKIDRSKIETIVKLSYDHLKSEDTKTLFLLCGLIGGTIQVETLLSLGMGLGLFEEFGRTIGDSRNGLDTMVHELRSACLLLHGGNDKNKVIIHDLYSEVVVSTPFRDQKSLMVNRNYGSSSKEKLEKCWAICLDDVGRDKLAELMMCQFPSLKILMLSIPEVSDWIEEHQHDIGDCSGLLNFTGMKELQVLYLRFMHITNLPLSIEILGNLRSLFLYKCNVKDVAIIGKLKALEILSFARSTIDRLPKEMGELTNLRLLNLSDCKELMRIEPGVLKRLIKLEELHMKGSFDRWMGKNEKPSESFNAGLAELRSMKKLSSLEISIRDPILLLEVDDLPFENLTRFWINIGNVYGKKFKCLRTMMIKLEGHDSILSKTWVQKILQKTQYLCLVGLGEFENTYKLCIQGFLQLKHLDIRNSPSIKDIASSSNSAFAILESLLLDNLINLENICHGHITAGCFSKLKAVRVKGCNRLEYLWSLSHMQNLVQLEKIKVQNCNSMRAIARKDTVPADCIVELPYLRHLYLADLPNMRSFCPRAEMTSEGTPIQVGVVDEGGGVEGTELVTTTSYLQNTYSDSFFDKKASLPNLEKLNLYSVGSFKRIWHDELSKSSFCKLATITVMVCSHLLHIFPSTIIGRLHNLKSVRVNSCPSLKTLLDCESLDSNIKQTTVLLPELVSIDIESCPFLELLFNCGSLDSNVEDLKLDSMGSFKRIWHDELSRSSFCKLATITIKNCSNLLHIFPSTIIGRLHNLKSVEVDNCPSLESLFNHGSLVSTAEHKIILLPKLKRVMVSGAKKLRHVVMSHSQIVLGFPSLEFVNVEDCSDLRYLFPKYTATTLEKLDWLKITKCEQMKEVILEKEASRSEAEVMSFPCLRVLILKELNNLISFGSGSVRRQLGKTAEENDELPQSLFNEMVTFPKMRHLQIEGVPCKELWNNHVLTNSSVCSHRFLPTDVKVKNCPSLKSLFDFGSLDSNAEQNAVLLPELETIDVESCPSLESLFNCGSLVSTAEHKIILLPKLKQVRVSGAKKLRHVVMSHSQIVLGFPSLEFVTVENCSDLRYLFPKYTATTLEKLDWLEITKCEQMKEVILEKEAGRSEAEVMSFPCLSTLTLKELDNLISFSSGSVKRQLGEIVEENDELPQPLFNEMVTFPNMRNLKIEGVPCKELWNNHVLTNSSVCSHRFLPTDVEVKNCPSLKSLFDFGSLDSNTKQNAVLLLELERINVESCPSMESLFNCGSLDSNAEHKIILLPKLEEVRVSGAKKLRHVVMSHS